MLVCEECLDNTKVRVMLSIAIVDTPNAAAGDLVLAGLYKRLHALPANCTVSTYTGAKCVKTLLAACPWCGSGRYRSAYLQSLHPLGA